MRHRGFAKSKRGTLEYKNYSYIVLVSYQQFAQCLDGGWHEAGRRAAGMAGTCLLLPAECPRGRSTCRALPLDR